MQSRSERFDRAIVSSHFTVVEAELLRGGESVAVLPVTGGSWTDDATAAVRRRCTLSVVPLPELLPSREWATDFGLWPLGNEIQLQVGVLYPNGDKELVPCGRYRISKPSVSDNGSRTLSIEGYDRSRSISRARFTVPYQIPSGTDYGTAIKDLLKSRMPTLTDLDFNFMVTDGTDGGASYTTPNLVFIMDDDPWLMAVEMAQSFGANLYFDGVGRATLTPQRDFQTIDFEYEEGEESNLLSLNRALDDERGYNGVIVNGENSEIPFPVHSERWDTDPNSPTYFDPNNPEASQYGPVPYFMSSQFITTQEQADNAAESNFYRVTGILEEVGFNAIVHPAHEAGDMVHIGRAGSGVEGLYIIDSFTCGLGPTGTMQASTRKRRAF